MNRDGPEISRDEIGKAVLIMDPHPGNEIVAVHIFMKMGSMFEGEEHSGISNLMQNLLLKGTERMDSEELDGRLDSLGSKLVTTTGKETGSLSLLTTREETTEALELMADVILRPAMTETEFEKERELVLDEIRQRRDELLTHALDLFQDAFYGSHPLHKTVQGNEKALLSAGVEDVRVCREMVYTPENMVFACSGDFEPEKMRDLVSRIVEELSRAGEGREKSLLAEGLYGRGAPAGRDRAGGTPKMELEEREISAAWIVL